MPFGIQRIKTEEPRNAVLLLQPFLRSTVLTRLPGKREYNLQLLWSWKEAWVRLQNTSLTPDLRYGLLIEILLNLVLLLPAGFLLPLTLNRKVKVIFGLLFGLVVSAAI